MFNRKQSATIKLILLIVLQQSNVSTSSDDQCCRKRIECFECDSRFNPGCNDPFNQTRESGNLIYCNDLCVKLRHKYENTYYYIRSCADQFKNILIKKTEVCYSTRKKDGSYLCFCGHDRCNRSYIVRREFSLFNLLTFTILLNNLNQNYFIK